MKLRTLNGTTLEGGGQLVRLSICLSALTGRPIQIKHIRGKRSGGGGLKEQHLRCVNWLADACDATTEGAARKSGAVRFEPGACRDGWWEHETIEKDGRKLRVRATRCTLGTAGAVTLVLQAVLPFILFAGSEGGHSSAPVAANGSSSGLEDQIQSLTLDAENVHPDQDPEPILLTLHGGTNVSNSPSIDYVTQVLLPNYRLLGLPLVELLNNRQDTQRRLTRGWATGHSSIGTVSLLIHPLPRNSTLPAPRCPPRGAVVKFTITILAPPDLRAYLASRCTRELQKRFCTAAPLANAVADESEDENGDKIESEREKNTSADPQIEVVANEDSGHPKRMHLLLLAHTSSGFRLGSDCLCGERMETGAQARQEVAARLVETAVSGLERELESGRCLDGWMEDQVVVFQALAEGRSRVGVGSGIAEAGDERLGDEADEDGHVWDQDYRGAGVGRSASLHTLTVRWVANEILGVVFNEDGECTGAGYVVGRGIPPS